MSDLKYGRLFTEADVIRLVQAARYTVARDPGEDVEAWPREMLAAYDGDLPADEPLFLLRASDGECAADAVAAFGRGRARLPDRDHTMERRAQVATAYDAMRLWGPTQ